MGYYLQGPNQGKADYLLETYPAFREITQDEAKLTYTDDHVAVVVVAENDVSYGSFTSADAAAFITGERDMTDFTLDHDPRPKRFLSGPRVLVEELSGYRMTEAAN